MRRKCALPCGRPSRGLGDDTRTSCLPERVRSRERNALDFRQINARRRGGFSAAATAKKTLKLPAVLFRETLPWGRKMWPAKRILFGAHEHGGGGFSVSLDERTEAACFFAVKTTKGGEIAAFNGSFKVCPDLLSVFRAAAAALTNRSDKILVTAITGGRQLFQLFGNKEWEVNASIGAFPGEKVCAPDCLTQIFTGTGAPHRRMAACGFVLKRSRGFGRSARAVRPIARARSAAYAPPR